MLLSEVDDHRAQINGITTLAENDLASYAATIVNEAPEKVAVQLRAAGGAVISQYGEVAAVSGALFYETNRPAAGFTAPLVAPVIGDDVASALGWAFVPFFKPDDFANGPLDALPRLAGVAQKFIATADRDTIYAAAKGDRLSTGVQSYARAGACAFCAMLSARSEHGGHWHDSCKCVPVPSWRDAPAPPSEVRDQHTEAVDGAIAHITHLRTTNPDFGEMKTRQFLRVHPELALTNKNIARVMREVYGFAH